MFKFDYKEYARQMRVNAIRDSDGAVKVSSALWDRLADLIEDKPTAEFIKISRISDPKNIIKVCKFLLDERRAEDIPLNEFCNPDEIRKAARSVLEIFKGCDDYAKNT